MRHRLARAGGAGDQQVRHLGQVGHDRIAGDVLAQRQRERRMHRVVGLGAEDLRQAHHLAVRVGNLEAHAGLAGDGLHHADRHHRQRARQVLHQVDDLAALDAHRRLDLVARDDRPGIGGQHLHRDAEIGQLLLDQARGELERLGGHLLAVVLRLVEQLERRQRRVGQVLEQRRLLLLLHALGFLDLAPPAARCAAADGPPRAASRSRPRSSRSSRASSPSLAVAPAAPMPAAPSA